MTRAVLVGVLVFCLITLAGYVPAGLGAQQGAGVNWPAFRGPSSSGTESRVRRSDCLGKTHSGLLCTSIGQF